MSCVLFYVCLFVCFVFRILKVLTQVKNTFATLRGVMSLLGSLQAEGRDTEQSRTAVGYASSHQNYFLH